MVRRQTLFPRHVFQDGKRLLAVSLVVLAALFMPNALYAQLSGTYTIDPVGGNYASFGDAVAALESQGISGPVTFLVAAGTYTEQVELSSVTGSSATNTITFDGVDPSTRVLEYNTTSSTDFVFRLNGADYVRIQNLTVRALGVTYGWGVHLTNNANFNQILDCTVEVSTSTTNSFCIPILASSTGTPFSYGNWAHSTLVQGNTVIGGYYGVRFLGPSSGTNSFDNHVINNTIRDFRNYGVFMYYQGRARIIGNTIHYRGDYNSSYAVYLWYNREGAVVERNDIVIGDYGVYMYYCNQDETVRGSLANNMIVCSGTGANHGMYAYNCHDFDVVYNSMHLLRPTSTTYGLYSTGYTDMGFAWRNNIVRADGTGTCYLFYSDESASSAHLVLDNNCYYAPNGSEAYRVGGYYYSLSSWKSGYPGFNSNSLYAEPGYLSAYDLHTYSPTLNDAGAPFTGVTDDFDGDARSATSPDIGADEYTLYPIDAAATALVAPIEGCGLGAGEDIVITITNYGTSTLDASVNPVLVTAEVQGPNPQSFNAMMTSGIIPPGATYNFTVTSSLDLSVPGVYTFDAYANAVGDGNAQNGDMNSALFTVDRTIASFPYSEDFEGSDGGWRALSLDDGFNSWEWGHPNYSGTYDIDNANSGQNAWMTNLNAGYDDDELAYLMSPCVDMSTLTAPVFQFYANIATENNYDAVKVQGSNDGGQTWTDLLPVFPAYTSTSYSGPIDPPKYSGNTLHGWRKYVFLLTSYAGDPYVRLRILFGSDGSVNGYPGIAVDDVAIGDFPKSDMTVTSVFVDYATDYWARIQNRGHVVHATVVNNGYEENPATISLTYKEGALPSSAGDGTNETLAPDWDVHEGQVTFTTELDLMNTGSIPVFGRVFHAGDANTGNDHASIMLPVFTQKVFGFENFDLIPAPDFDKGWTMVNPNDNATWSTEPGMGLGGSASVTYPGDAVPANDWLFTPGAELDPGASYAVNFMYRSRAGAAQRLEVAFGDSPDPGSMTVFATFDDFTNTSFTAAIGEYGVPPFFATPQIGQKYYIGFHVVSAPGAGPLDIDDIKLLENPYPPPKIAYGVAPNFVEESGIPMEFSGVYKKTGLLSRTIQVVNATGWYGDPPGDMIWDVNSNTPWITLIKSTPDPLSYLKVNPFDPPWARQNQTFTIEINASVLPPGTSIGELELDAYLHNSFYSRGIRATNAILRVPVEVTLSSAGGTGTGGDRGEMTRNDMTSGGNPWIFQDGQGITFAVVYVRSGSIPSMTIRSYPGQLPEHLSRYRYVKHYWSIETDGTDWEADIEFHYFDSEVIAGFVLDEHALEGGRIPTGTSYWELPIDGTWSAANAVENFVTVNGITDKNYDGQIAVASPWGGFLPGKETPGVPSAAVLEQNFPNPFNPSTDIRYGIPEDGHVTLTVSNSLGEEIMRLVDGQVQAGYHTVHFDATDLPSGMYIYTLNTNSFTQTKTMVLGK